ncbi:uncharacterized protein N7483_006412 [Penicillium malachiteum]|uniref:uncharacterized protein n=1 Tax=Penicillium malachiteum TaxID=1324776 RepID=UPI0025489E75|nr:uncharacterized protein N7483_006412 [Penicillium malachiteum]KAJ5725055.1 hypothetical protein N7483_006412 [Penicillium malachiteum]
MNSVRQFSIEELTISTFHSALREGLTSCSEVTNAYLARITKYDPTLKALININPNAENEALQKDSENKQYLTQNRPFPPLHGVPIILKDNYTTFDLPTTAGIKALQSLQTVSDCDIVSRLRHAGAIILAKANLHELALHGTTTSSLRGQTLNPYDLHRTPGGSSGGTAVALAANLGLVGCGTDTVNSLRSPASACSIVGFRPSIGLVDTKGVVPVSDTQDVAGPMARSVGDVKILFDVMRGNNGVEIGTGYSDSTRRDGGLRIGILDAYFELEDIGSCENAIGAENATVQSIIRKALILIQDLLDVSLIPVECDANWGIAHLLANADTQAFEFQECLDSFLQSSDISSTPHRSLESIVQSGEYHKEAVTEVFFVSVENPSVFSRSSEEYRARLDTIAALKESVKQCFDKHNLDALVYPHQRHLVVNIGATRQPNRNGILAAVTGNPAICIPAGFSPPTPSAHLGIPVGIEFMGRHGHDDELLDIAEQVESLLQIRHVPALFSERLETCT